MKFSIATPVFNGMPELRRCVGSIRGQCMPRATLQSLNVETPKGSSSDNPASMCNDLNEGRAPLNETVSIDVQHIVQDGGSTDGSVDWLRQYDTEVREQGAGDRGRETGGGGQGAGDAPLEAAPSTDSTRPEGPFQRAAKPRFNDSSSPCPMRHVPCPSRYSFTWSSERDAGMYDAINKAWAKADGDILSWLNADEQYLPGTLRRIADYFDSHPDVDAVFGDYICVDPHGSPLVLRREIPLRKLYVVNGFLNAASCTLFYRRKLWDDGLLRLNADYRYSADADLVLRLLTNGVRFRHLREVLSLFQIVPGENLSSHDAMYEESARIKGRYGAFRSPILRRAVAIARVAERLVRGCYSFGRVSYVYRLSEEDAGVTVCERPRHVRFGRQNFQA
jgi:glycosyltransferase involved in cell wall biosynthesis